MDIGARIRYLRENAELTQLALAKILKVRNSTLSQYEKGIRIPSDDVKIAIADYFDVSIDYLLGHEHKNGSTIGGSERVPEFIQLYEQLPKDQQISIVKQMKGLLVKD